MARPKTTPKQKTKNKEKELSKKLKAELLVNLEKYPIVQTACQKAGVGRSTFYSWCQQDTDFAKRAMTATVEGKKFINDMAESQLIKSIGNGNMTAVIYWLKNNHADYVDKVRYLVNHQHSHKVKLTNDQKAEVRKAMMFVGIDKVVNLETMKESKEDEDKE